VLYRFVILAGALLACEGDDATDPCAGAAGELEPSAVFATFRIGDDPDVWLIQRGELPPRCAGLTTPARRLITISTTATDSPRATLTHELGHAIGILDPPHLRDPNAVMFTRVGAVTLTPADLAACASVGACAASQQPPLAFAAERSGAEWNAVLLPNRQIRFNR